MFTGSRSSQVARFEAARASFSDIDSRGREGVARVTRENLETSSATASQDEVGTRPPRFGLEQATAGILASQRDPRGVRRTRL